MLSDMANDRRQLPDLVADRLADRLAIAQPAAAAIATLGRVLDRAIGVGDHRAMMTLMPGLPARLAARTLPRRALGRLRRIAGRRPRAVRRVLAQPTAQLLQLDHHQRQLLTQRRVLCPQLAKLVRPSHAT